MLAVVCVTMHSALASKRRVLVCVLDDGWCLCAENVGCDASLCHSEINGNDFAGSIKCRGGGLLTS